MYHSPSKLKKLSMIGILSCSFFTQCTPEKPPIEAETTLDPSIQQNPIDFSEEFGVFYRDVSKDDQIRQCDIQSYHNYPTVKRFLTLSPTTQEAVLKLMANKYGINTLYLNYPADQDYYDWVSVHLNDLKTKSSKINEPDTATKPAKKRITQTIKPTASLLSSSRSSAKMKDFFLYEQIYALSHEATQQNFETNAQQIDQLLNLLEKQSDDKRKSYLAALKIIADAKLGNQFLLRIEEKKPVLPSQQ